MRAHDGGTGDRKSGDHGVGEDPMGFYRKRHTHDHGNIEGSPLKQTACLKVVHGGRATVVCVKEEGGRGSGAYSALRFSSHSQVTSTSEWFRHCTLRNLMVLLLV